MSKGVCNRKVFALLFTFIFVVANASAILASSENHSNANTIEATDTSATDGNVFCRFSVGNLTVSMSFPEPERHFLARYEQEGKESFFEVKVSPCPSGYRTTTLVDNVVVADEVYSVNPLASSNVAPPVTEFVTAGTPDPPQITASYTYDHWDTIYFVMGPSYLIKYPHPDRDTYQISIWTTTYLVGSELFHHQIDKLFSRLLIYGGWSAIFAAIGAFFGAKLGGGAGAALGAAVGAMLGHIFGYVTQAKIGDEAECVWWWWGRDFDAWFWANLWWLLLVGQFWFTYYVSSQLFSIGYFRVGSHTFANGVGIADP